MHTLDVVVVETGTLDEEFAINFKKPWFIQASDGTTKEYDTEEDACKAQREHRISVGLDPITGV